MPRRIERAPNRLLSFIALFIAMGLFSVGCRSAEQSRLQNREGSAEATNASSSRPSTLPAGLLVGKTVDELESTVFAPEGWTLELHKERDNSEHRTWVSPTGKTAFGVIFFKLPLPVGAELAFKYGFLPAMRQAEGEAKVIEQSWNRATRSLDFVVEGGKYTLRAAMFVRGLRGWTYYAGTLRGQDEDQIELKLAEDARDWTKQERAPRMKK